MCTPVSLRAWCMAAMPPTLTEAANHARNKLTTPTTVTQNLNLVNGKQTPPEVAPVLLSPQTKENTNGKHPLKFESILPQSDLVDIRNKLDSLAEASRIQALHPIAKLGTLSNLKQIYMKECLISNTDISKDKPIAKVNNKLNSQSVMQDDGLLADDTIMGLEATTRPVALDSEENGTNTAMAKTTLDVPVNNSSLAMQNVSNSTQASDVDIAELMSEATKRQKILERRSVRLLKHLNRVRSVQTNGHVHQQLSGFVDSQHKTLQAIARTARTPTTTADLKAEILQSEDVKSLSTAALVHLVRKVQSRQALTLQQRLANEHIVPQPNSVLKLDDELCTELQRVSGHLESNLRHTETAIDSDATEASSGGESSEEGDYDHEWDGQCQLSKSAEWKWVNDRSAVAARWTWLQAQVSDLEYRIRQQTDIYRQIKATKGSVVLGDPPSPEDIMARFRLARTGKKLSPLEAKIANLEKKNEMSPCNLSAMLNNVDRQAVKLTQSMGPITPQSSPAVGKGVLQTPPPKPINGFIDPGAITPGGDLDNEALARTSWHDGSSAVSPPDLDLTCQSARCRPVRSYRKRKLLRTAGLHHYSRKAARLANVKCYCYPPVTSCIICGGRYNNVQPLDPNTMPLRERVSLLDPAFHPVLSFSQDVPLTVKFQALLKSGEWQRKLPVKTMKLTKSEQRKASSILIRKKYSRKLTKNSTTTTLISSKLRNRLLENKLSQKDRKTEYKIKRRKAALHAMAAIQRKSRSLSLNNRNWDRSPSPSYSELSHSLSSSALKDMKDAVKKRRIENAYGIDNIVIPYSMAASTRLEKIQYKEIITPKWREVSTIKSELPIKEEDEELEDLSDEIYAERHLRCEIQEKKRFMTGLQKQPSRARSSRTDSCSTAVDTPLPPASPLSDGLFTSVHLNTPPSTPISQVMADDKAALRRPFSTSTLVNLVDSKDDSGLKRTLSCHTNLQGIEPKQEYDEDSESIDARRELLNREQNYSDERSKTCTPELEREVIHPWLSRSFPLTDEEQDFLTKMDMTPCPPPPIRPPRATKTISNSFLFDSVATPGSSNPCSPRPSSSSSSLIEDDPDDPEWTVISPEKQVQQQIGLVLKLAKR